MFRPSSFLLLCAALASSALAEVRLPQHFSDHLVLQRETKVPIWGTADAGEKITVSIAGQRKECVAGPDGAWIARLDEMPAGGPFDLVVTGSNTVTLKDVLVGEVWLASGQSNMDFTVAKTEKYYFAGVARAEEEIAAANHPRLRMFTADWTMRDQPQRDVVGTWKACTPENVGEFSAVAYFFARELQRQLDVPVGILTCTYGASTAQAWISREALSASDDLRSLTEKFDEARARFESDAAARTGFERASQRWQEASAAAKAEGKAAPRKPKNPDPVQDQHNPTVLFNGMIAPVIPYALRGAIWYQGESNAGDALTYLPLMRTLIADWRTRWGLGDFPFYFVQLANYKEPVTEPQESRLASLRDAQTKTLSVPKTGMAVTIDIGDAKNVHPKNKQDVGLRLARIALARTYGQKMEDSGPVCAGANVEGGAIRLRFEHAGNGLVAKDGPLKQFAIAGADRQFVWAEARIDGESIVVSSPEVPAPAFVRYAWADNPEGCNLYNGDGLPAVPFRTDP